MNYFLGLLLIMIGLHMGSYGLSKIGEPISLFEYILGGVMVFGGIGVIVSKTYDFEDN